MRLPWFSGVITAVILVAMLTPAESIPETGISGSDVLAHLATFTLWGFVVSREFAAAPMTVLTAGMGLAVGTELLQILVPGRMFSFWDILTDAIGLIIGVALAILWASRRVGDGSGGQDRSANKARAAGESQANAS